ncbi:MAG TPA: hypothetical protein VEP90_18490 [Methylomirabilota bacterium]|nr:hypothetical protein [Methylomirabilota bacterium]
MAELIGMSFTEELSVQIRAYAKNHNCTRQEVVRIALRKLFAEAPELQKQ